MNGWTQLFVKFLAFNFLLSLIATNNVAGQEKVKFPRADVYRSEFFPAFA